MLALKLEDVGSFLKAIGEQEEAEALYQQVESFNQEAR